MTAALFYVSSCRQKSSSRTGTMSGRIEYCSGSGLRMVPRTYKVRAPTEADRERNERFINAAAARGDLDEAQLYRESFAKWGTEQGEEHEVLVCAICDDRWLKPTAKGTARPHRRRDGAVASWDRVRQLRKELAALQEELDRVLTELEP